MSACPAAVALLLVPGIALACQCAPLDSSARIANADIVMVGRVTAFKPLDSVTVSRVETFKGRPASTMTIETGKSDCDFFLAPVRPKIGDEYLLYLRRADGRFTVSRCLAPGLAADRAQELRELRLWRQVSCKGSRSSQLMLTLLFFDAACEGISPETRDARTTALEGARSVFPRCFGVIERNMEKHLARTTERVIADEATSARTRAACQQVFEESRYQQTLEELRTLRDDPAGDSPRR